MKKFLLVGFMLLEVQLQAASLTPATVVKAAGSPVVASSVSPDQTQAARYWGCTHSTQPNSKSDCDAIVAANDYVSMVQLCSANLSFSGQKGVIDFCGLVNAATGASVVQAISNNTNKNGVDLGYMCSHTNLPGSKQACSLLLKGAQAMDYNSAFSAVQLCATGLHDDMCTIIANAGNNANVLQAIGDNSNTKGVQLGYMCMHPTSANNPGAQQACNLVLQGVAGGNYDAAFSAVQACSAGGYDAMCSAVESNSSNANVVQAIGDNSNNKGVHLGYSCMHPASGHNPGYKNACELIKIGVAGGNYDAAYSAVQACSASGYDDLCTALAGAQTNASVVKAIGDNSNGKGVLLGNTCMHSNLPGHQQSCTLLAQGVAGDNYDAAYSAVQACSAGAYDDLCSAINAAGEGVNIIKAIGDNSNHKGNQLGYRCMHANLGGAAQSCQLLAQGIAGQSYDAAFSGVQVCSAGSNDDVCQAITKVSASPNIIQAIGDNSNGKGVQLGYTCMHSNLAGHAQSCVLLAQGAAGANSDAALSAVEVCSSGLNDALCQAISSNAKNNNIVQAIVSNQNSGVNLGYACSHGSQESCQLLALIPGGEVANASPVVAPSQPVVVPTSPVVAPSQPVVVPTSPVVAPSQPVVVPTSPVVAPSQPIAYGPLVGQCNSGQSSACQTVLNGANNGDQGAISAAQNLCGLGGVPANFQGPVCGSFTAKNAPAAPVAPPVAGPLPYWELAGQCSAGQVSACQSLSDGVSTSAQASVFAQGLCNVDGVPAPFATSFCNI